MEDKELKLRAKLWQKLLAVKKQIPVLNKDKQGFNYDYVSPDQILATINPLLNDAGLFLKTEVLDESHERILSKYKYVKVYNELEKKYENHFMDVFETLFHLSLAMHWIDTETGYSEVSYWRSSGVMNEEQGVGSALTYAERYFILKQFQISTSKMDPDNRQSMEPATKPPKLDSGTKKTVKTADTKKAETPPAAAEPKQPKEQKQELIDKKGNLQPNPAFQGKEEKKPAADEKKSREDAKKVFAGFNQEQVLLYVNDVLGLPHKDVNAFIDAENLEVVRSVARKFKPKDK